MTRGYRSWAIATVLAMLLAACGGDGSAEDEAPTSTTAAQAGVSEDTEPDDSTETESTTTTLAETSEEELPTTGNGTAVLTIGGTTYEFSGLTCFDDEAAIEASGDDDAFFAAFARDGDTALLITVGDAGTLERMEVFYQPDGPELWYMSGMQSLNDYTFEDGRITADGEFEKVIDGVDTGRENGSVEAGCG